MPIDPADLVKTLDRAGLDTLQAATALCRRRGHYTVELEHWLLTLLQVDGGDFDRIFKHFGASRDRAERDIAEILNRIRSGNTRNPAVSPQIDTLIREAWLLASVPRKDGLVRTGHLLRAIVEHPELSRVAREISDQFALISAEALQARFESIVGPEESDAAVREPFRGDPSSLPTATRSSTSALDQYTTDLTEKARSGEVDPIIGRDAEIRQMIDILIRRRQNNPILTGEAGVGKTAVVEGFAQRLAAGQVPEALKNASVKALDLGLLEAGASAQGEFEKRLKAVIDEVKASNRSVILFIDEAHTLIGAGGQAGVGDAANLLKPALARGELRTIAATTWAEYKQYFEKDAALARRFQVVKIDEPGEEAAIDMMRAMAPVLEKHHGVLILDEAIRASVKLSTRYISGRQLPDKSVSLLDTACARVALSQASQPGVLEAAQQEIHTLSAEMQRLDRERKAGADHQQRINELQAERSKAEALAGEVEERWKKEDELVEAIRRKQADLGKATGEGETSTREELGRLESELAMLQGGDPLVHVCVTSQVVAEVVSSWTGIPVGRMQADEIHGVLDLASRMAERIIGQDSALQAIAQRVQTARAGLTDPLRPIGVFLLVGPSGVGKTETAATLAEALYGGERNLITINMSEFQEPHTVSLLKGSPPGYVGYGEGGVLTEAVRRKPHSVLLLDEVEKAHPDVLELFYQVFDKGMLEDGEGRSIDFRHTVILLTTNVGSDLTVAITADPANQPTPDELVDALRPELHHIFKPALIGRTTIVPYFPLSDAVLLRITHLQLGRIGKRLADQHGATFTYDDALAQQIASRCTEVNTGARNVDHIITRTLLPSLSQAILSRMISAQPVTTVHAGLDPEGEILVTINQKRCKQKTK